MKLKHCRSVFNEQTKENNYFVKFIMNIQCSFMLVSTGFLFDTLENEATNDIDPEKILCSKCRMTSKMIGWIRGSCWSKWTGRRECDEGEMKTYWAKRPPVKIALIISSTVESSLQSEQCLTQINIQNYSIISTSQMCKSNYPTTGWKICRVLSANGKKSQKFNVWSETLPANRLSECKGNGKKMINVRRN